MANIKKLDRMRKKVSNAEQVMLDAKKRYEKIFQELVHLEEEEIINTIRSAKLTPEEVKEMIVLFNKEKVLQKVREQSEVEEMEEEDALDDENDTYQSVY